jgi:hypothetical protein
LQPARRLSYVSRQSYWEETAANLAAGGEKAKAFSQVSNLQTKQLPPKDNMKERRGSAWKEP